MKVIGFYCYKGLPVFLFKGFTFFPLSDVDAPFARWSKDQVCEWLQEQGLGLYVNMARVWISSGQTLLQASQQDLERVRGTSKNYTTMFTKYFKYFCVYLGDVTCNCLSVHV